MAVARAAFWALLVCLAVGSADILSRTRVPGTFELHLRKRTAANVERVKIARWNVSDTAIIVVDMWRYHACVPAQMRVEAMVPGMNEWLVAARNHGAQIIHAPSLGGSEYEGMIQRRRMQNAAQAVPPTGLRFALSKWETVNEDRAREPPVPIVGPPASSCDDIDPVEPEWDLERGYGQHDGIQIYPFDGVSDEPQEIFNFLRQERITNVAIAGVHTNECILKRAFGIRALLELGLRVVLVRDLTDAMYDSRNPPHVSHARGTEMVVEHIERHLCPSILSSDLLRVIPGSAGP